MFVPSPVGASDGGLAEEPVHPRLLQHLQHSSMWKCFLLCRSLQKSDDNFAVAIQRSASVYNIALQVVPTIIFLLFNCFVLLAVLHCCRLTFESMIAKTCEVEHGVETSSCESIAL